MSGFSKPSAGTVLNRVHPISRGLVGAWLFNEGGGRFAYSAVGQYNPGILNDRMHLIGDSYFGAGPYGLGLVGPNSGSRSGGYIGDQVNGVSGAAGTQPACSMALRPVAVTIFWRGVVRSNGNRSNNPALAGMFYDGANSSPFISYAIGRPAADATGLYFSYNSPSNTFTTFTGVVSNDVPFSVCLSRISGSSKFYKNGQLLGSDTTAGDITYSTIPIFCVNVHGSDLSATCDSVTDVVYVWNRVLHPDEVAEIS